MEGTHPNSRHAYNPHEDFQLRNREDFLRHGREADALQAVVKGISIYGVFGCTQSTNVFPTIPLGAPIDYMHQVGIVYTCVHHTT